MCADEFGEVHSAYITLQQVEHALLSDLLGIIEFLKRLFEFVICQFALTFLFIIKV